MTIIHSDLIKEAIYNLCFEANIHLDKKTYTKISELYKSCNDLETKSSLAHILKNAQIAYKTKRPLCQDTGQVLIFLEIGQEIQIQGEDLNETINQAIEKCYIKNCLRKSVVKDAFLKRENTKTNTPAIIYTEIVKGNSLKINLLIKGAGSENKSISKMLLPTASKKEIKDFITQSVLESGTNSCPPLSVGIGIGGTQDKAALLAKKALISESQNKDLISFAEDIKESLNKKAPKGFENSYAINVNIKTAPTHIASMPVAISLNCHSTRKASCIIENNNIIYADNDYNFTDIKLDSENTKKVNTSQIEEIRNLKQNENILLSGEIYVARDAAHKRILELIESNKKLPIEIKDKIILYAGPCPAKPGEIIGPIGPTTSSRMDKYASIFYGMGLLATIGKGERNKEVETAIKNNAAKYFTLLGGIASLIAQNIEKSDIIAFKELGAEAVYKLKIKDLPLKVAL